jgi:hypothetical protein
MTKNLNLDDFLATIDYDLCTKSSLYQGGDQSYVRFQIEDIDTVATSSLTDKATNGDDQKCDLIYVDKDTGYINEGVIQAISNYKDFVESSKDYHTDLFQKFTTQIHVCS